MKSLMQPSFQRDMPCSEVETELEVFKKKLENGCTTTILPDRVNNATGVKKKSRLCWDGTTKGKWWEITMNEVTPMEQEAIITFG